jgi:hypothetical protein
MALSLEVDISSASSVEDRRGRIRERMKTNLKFTDYYLPELPGYRGGFKTRLSSIATTG